MFQFWVNPVVLKNSLFDPFEYFWPFSDSIGNKNDRDSEQDKIWKFEDYRSLKSEEPPLMFLVPQKWLLRLHLCRVKSEQKINLNFSLSISISSEESFPNNFELVLEEFKKEIGHWMKLEVYDCNNNNNNKSNFKKINYVAYAKGALKLM